jgi:hypothetical protein
MFSALTVAELGEAAEDAEELGCGACVPGPRDGSPLEPPFMWESWWWSPGLVGVREPRPESPPEPGPLEPMEWSRHPPPPFGGATRAMTSGGRRTPELGSPFPEGTNSLSECGRLDP